jgi:hypothetical protein
MLDTYRSLEIGKHQQILDGKIAQLQHYAAQKAYASAQPFKLGRIEQFEQCPSSYSKESVGSEVPTAATGILSGTCLSTPEGPVPIENLRPGDYVQTFDDGFQQIQSIGRSWAWPDSASREINRKLVWIDYGAHGNSSSLLLPPGQPIMIESDLAESVLGDPFAVVTAESLIGASCSEYVSICDVIEIHTIRFESPQLVYCAGGALLWFDGKIETQKTCKQRQRYQIFDGSFGQLLSRVEEYLPRYDRQTLLRNFYMAEEGAVSVDFVILTAAAAGLGAVMLSIIGPSGVDLAQSVGDFLANRPLTTY